MDLEDYLFGTVEVPMAEDAFDPTLEEIRAFKEYRRNRAKVGLLLCNTLLDPYID
jgi:hypothetical protein